MSYIVTTALLPGHSSSLLQLSHEVTQCYEGSNHNNFSIRRKDGELAFTDRDWFRREGSYCTGLLTLFCHRDGSVWRGLKPLLFDVERDGCCAEDKTSSNNGDACSVLEQSRPRSFAATAVEVLLCQFWSCVQTLTASGSRTQAVISSNRAGKGIDQIDSTKSEDDLGCYSATQENVWYKSSQRISSSKLLHLNGDHVPSRKLIRIIIVILPPSPFLGLDPPSLYPERSFASRLVILENFQLRLQTLNAFFSTLGGGYFLCRYLTTAVRLARSQRAVALAMGDRDTAARCTVNEAYNYVHAGLVREALLMLRTVKKAAEERGDNLTVTMCRSARLFAKRVGKAKLFEGDGLVGSDGSITTEGEVQEVRFGVPIKTEASERQQTYDDFQRIRMVHKRARI